jgi:hypothetical protein
VINVSKATGFDWMEFQEGNTVNSYCLGKYLQRIGQDIEQPMGTPFEQVHVLYHIIRR